MVKFISASENKNEGSIASYIDNINPILSINLAKQLNSRVKKRCEKHPDVDSIIAVSATPIQKFVVQHACCEDFRVELERFISNT